MMLSKRLNITLVTNVENIVTTGFVLKTKNDTDKSDLEKKRSDVDKKFLMLVIWFKKQTKMLKLLK